MTQHSSAALDPTAYVAKPADGRDCGTCTLCCKVYDVPVLAKPAGKWCSHCTPGKGCGIHEMRPEHCRAFNCLWMTEGWLGPEWKPERSRFVLTIDPVTKFLLIQVDPGSPKAWRAEPYFTQIQQWAAAAADNGRFVMVFNNKSATLLLPEGEVELGVIKDGERIITRRRNTPYGPRFDVIREPAQG
jgi:hypothetical protein